MQLRAAIITVKRITLAVVQVEPEQTYPEPANAVLLQAQQIFTALPIMLLAPRIGGFSRSYATFNVDSLISEINADTIDWQKHSPPVQDRDAPF
ncbi:MAG: hypothetical protein K2X55_01080 [Burkholderiaceae bacterium]|nr:hypothetical protein [Burkholderiaceae bacterium]